MALIASGLPKRIAALLVSPLQCDHDSLKVTFSQSDWQLHSAYSAEEALALIRERSIPVVVCASDSRDGWWRILLEATAGMHCPPKVIVYSRLADDRLWLDVLHLGGYTLLDSPLNEKDVVTDVWMAWHSWCRDTREEPSRPKRETPAPAENMDAFMQPAMS